MDITIRLVSTRKLFGGFKGFTLDLFHETGFLNLQPIVAQIDQNHKLKIKGVEAANEGELMSTMVIDIYLSIRGVMHAMQWAMENWGHEFA